MDLLNKLGILSFVMTLIALYFLAIQNRIGWIIFLPSYGSQIYIFFKTKQKFLIFQMIVLFLYSIVNFFMWGK